MVVKILSEESKSFSISPPPSFNYPRDRAISEALIILAIGVSPEEIPRTFFDIEEVGEGGVARGD